MTRTLTIATSATYVNALDGAEVVYVDTPQMAKRFVPFAVVKADASTNTVVVTDGVNFSHTLSVQGESVTLVSDGQNYAVTRGLASVLTDGDYGDLVVSGGGTAMNIDTAVATTAGRAIMAGASASAQRTSLGLGTAALNNTGDFDAVGAAAAAQAASLPLHGTADDSGKVGATTPTAAGLALLAGTNAAAQRTSLALGTLATQSGTFSGTSSGTNTGDQTTVSGNAGTATALQTARNINGVAFDGTANITVAADGSTLTGSVLAAALISTTATTACAGNDSRLSDSRAPNGSAGGDLTGTYPNPTIKASASLTTPVIGVATGSSLAVTGAVTSSGTAGIGYASGAGTSATQATNKSTGVTLNTMSGQITMNNAALAAGAEVSFVVSNSKIGLQDVVIVCHQSAGTAGSYAAFANAFVAATSFSITVSNLSGGSLSEAIVLNFVVIKGVKV